MLSLRPLWPAIVGMGLLAELALILLPRSAPSIVPLPPPARVVSMRSFANPDSASIEVDTDRPVRLVASWVPAPGLPALHSDDRVLARHHAMTLAPVQACGVTRAELTLGDAEGRRTLTATWIRSKGRHARVVASRPSWAQARAPIPTMAGVLVAGVAEVTLLALDGTQRARAAIDGTCTVPPLVRAGVVVVGSDRGMVVGLDPMRLTTLWSVSLGSAVAGTLTSDGRRVFAATIDGRVAALNLASGRAEWSRDLDGEVTAGPSWADGRVLVGTDRARLEILASDDGQPVRSIPLGATPTARPISVSGHIYVALSSGRMLALDLPTGAVVATMDLGAPIIGMVATSTHALVASRTGLYRIDLSGPRIEGQVALTPVVAGPVVDAGGVTVGLADGTLRSFGADLTPSQTVELGCEARSLTLAGDRLFVLDAVGSLASVALR